MTAKVKPQWGDEEVMPPEKYPVALFLTVYSKEAQHNMWAFHLHKAPLKNDKLIYNL